MRDHRCRIVLEDTVEEPPAGRSIYGGGLAHDEMLEELQQLDGHIVVQPPADRVVVGEYDHTLNFSWYSQPMLRAWTLAAFLAGAPPFRDNTQGTSDA